MALTPDQDLEFDEDDLVALTGVLAELTGAGSGWVNLRPEVEQGQEPPPRSWLALIFSARGDAVPLATWTPPAAAGERSTLGIEHGSGPQALARLGEHDLGLRPGWLKVADHPRRGLVVTAPGDADPGDVLWWLLAASHALSTVPLSGAWRASIYRR
jgi:hypothetical protein